MKRSPPTRVAWRIRSTASHQRIISSETGPRRPPRRAARAPPSCGRASSRRATPVRARRRRERPGRRPARTRRAGEDGRRRARGRRARRARARSASPTRPTPEKENGRRDRVPHSRDRKKARVEIRQRHAAAPGQVGRPHEKRGHESAERNPPSAGLPEVSATTEPAAARTGPSFLVAAASAAAKASRRRAPPSVSSSASARAVPKQQQGETRAALPPCPSRNPEYRGSNHATIAAARPATAGDAPRRRSHPNRTSSVATWRNGNASAIAWSSQRPARNEMPA